MKYEHTPAVVIPAYYDVFVGGRYQYCVGKIIIGEKFEVLTVEDATCQPMKMNTNTFDTLEEAKKFLEILSPIKRIYARS